MEIRIGEMENYISVGTTYDLSDIFLSTNSVTVYVRFKATNTQPASSVQVIICDHNAEIVGNELEYTFRHTDQENWSALNPNESYEINSENGDSKLNTDEIEETFVEPMVGEYNFINSNDDLV